MHTDGVRHELHPPDALTFEGEEVGYLAGYEEHRARNSVGENMESWGETTFDPLTWPFSPGASLGQGEGAAWLALAQAKGFALPEWKLP